MLSESEIRARITELVGFDNGRYGKYCRNYKLYTGNPVADLNSKNPSTVGYLATNYSTALQDNTLRLNVVKSCVDAVVSKITQARCRPYVNTANGSFKDIQIAKNLQTFLDIYCDEQRFNYKVATAFRDACTFDTGYMYFDPDQKEWLRILPWNCYLDPNEISGGGSKLTQAFIHFPNYSVNQLPEELFKLIPKGLRQNTHIEYGVYYDTKTMTKAIVFANKVVKIEKGFNTIPLVTLYYTEPVIGNAPISIVDAIADIQIQVDKLAKKITEATRLSVAPTYFVPKSMGVPAGLLNNRVGNIIPVATNQDQIQMFSPAFINEQYTKERDDLIERAYNMIGISQLSAQGKKVAGLDSGVALATMEDIQSDRYETQLRQYVDTFTKMVKIMIEVLGSGDYANELISDNNRYTMKLTWKQVKEECGKLRLMFSSADSLSKDPSEKLKQLEALAQQGLIPASHIGQLLELPDIQTAYNLTSNAINAVSTVISKCIYDDNYSIPDYIPISMLKEEILNTQLLLQSAQGETNDNIPDIEKLNKLWEVTLNIEDKQTQMAQQEAVQQAQQQAQQQALSGQTSGDLGATEDELQQVNTGIEGEKADVAESQDPKLTAALTDKNNINQQQ